MDTLIAYAMAQANKGNRHKTFDWDKAYKIIKEQSVKNASAGLLSDYEWTKGYILKDGLPVDDGAFLASNWAIPMLIIEDTGEEIECWQYEDELPKEKTGYQWPASTLAIFNKGE